MSHEMIKVQSVWECTSCSRRVCFTADAQPVVMDPGNPVATHDLDGVR